MTDRGSTPLEARLDQLAHRLDEAATELGSLRHELVELRTSLAHEIRTRRVVILEEDGFARIVLETRGHYGRVGVLTREPRGEPANKHGQPTCIELVAHDAIDADPPNVAIALTDSGDVVATLEATQGRGPVLWIEPP